MSREAEVVHVVLIALLGTTLGFQVKISLLKSQINSLIIVQKAHVRVVDSSQ